MLPFLIPDQQPYYSLLLGNIVCFSQLQEATPQAHFFFKESVFSYLVIQIYHEEIENTNLCMILFKDHLIFSLFPSSYFL